MSEFNGVTQPVNVMFDINLKSRIQENREKLSPISDTIKLCGHLGLPLRGHIDDRKCHPELVAFWSRYSTILPYVDKISRGFNFADDENFQFHVDLISRLRPS